MVSVRFCLKNNHFRLNTFCILILVFIDHVFCVKFNKITIDSDVNNYLAPKGRHCNHEHPKHHEVVRGVILESPRRMRKREVSQPMRIALYYDDSVYLLESDKLNLINNTILPEAVKFWEKTLMVRKTEDSIRLNRKCSTQDVFMRAGRTHCIETCQAYTTCGEVKVPEEHLNPCYVCNATGHNCRALSEPELKASLESPGEDSTKENIVVGEDESTDNNIGDLIKNQDQKQSPGVSGADFVLYVSALETDRCKRGLTVAYAAHCQQEAALDRPVAGHANFCPGELSTRTQDLPSMMSTVQHEILHSLGFSVSLYAFYRDDDGNPLTERHNETGSPPLNEKLQIHQWSNRVVKEVTRNKWMVRDGYVSRTFNMLVTPRVVKEVRRHFDCYTLEGAELEDQGGEGTALTHWEKRVFENEAMTGIHTQSSVFSRVTLALMEDTGWYKANYSMAQELDWGKNMGCDFAMKSCKNWLSSKAYSNDTENEEPENRNASPLCSRIKENPLRTSCSPRRNAVVLCNLIRHDMPLPKIYQHFDKLPGVSMSESSHYGGSVTLADFCPYLQEFTWQKKDKPVRGSRCGYDENTPSVENNFALESYGGQAKCFDHNDQTWEQKSCRQIRQWSQWGSGCYKYMCENGKLHIMVGNYTYMCYHAGQVLRIRVVQGGWQHRGGIVCPPCREICQNEFEKQNKTCKPGDEAPPPTFYPNDRLMCGTSTSVKPSLQLIMTLLLSVYVTMALINVNQYKVSSRLNYRLNSKCQNVRLFKDKIIVLNGNIDLVR